MVVAKHQSLEVITIVFNDGGSNIDSPIGKGNKMNNGVGTRSTSIIDFEVHSEFEKNKVDF